MEKEGRRKSKQSEPQPQRLGIPKLTGTTHSLTPLSLSLQRTNKTLKVNKTSASLQRFFSSSSKVDCLKTKGRSQKKGKGKLKASKGKGREYVKGDKGERECKLLVRGFFVLIKKKASLAPKPQSMIDNYINYRMAKHTSIN